MNARKSDPTPRASGTGRSPLLFIFLTVFIDLLGFGIVLPLLPVYSLTYHMNEVELALLFSCFSGMQFLFAPMWGRLSDRIGRRPVLIGGLIGTSAAYVLFGFAHGKTLLFASRLMAGFFGANISTAQAYIADVTTAENRAKGMGLIGAAFGLGFTFGPLIGGELSSEHFATWLSSLLTRFSGGEWSASELLFLRGGVPGFLAAALSLSAAAFGFFKLPEPPRASRKPTRLFGAKELRHALREPRLGLLLVLSFLFIFCFSAFESMFTRFGLALFPGVFNVPNAIEKASIEQILDAAPIAGRYMCGIGLFAAIIQGGLIRRLVPRFGETKLAVAGPCILGASFFLIGLAQSWWLVIFACALMPFGFGLNNPALYGLISRASPQDEQGAYLGMNQSISSLARMCGPPFAGALFVHFGPHSPFVAAAAILLGCTLLAAHYRARFGASYVASTQPGVAEA